MKIDNPHKSRKIAYIRKVGFEPAIMYWQTSMAEQDAYDLERELIKRFGRKNIDQDGILTNICLDNRPPTSAGREVSPDTREKIASAQRGELNHRHGASWDDEQKELRRQYNLDNNIKPPIQSGPMSEEQKVAIGNGNRGKMDNL